MIFSLVLLLIMFEQRLSHYISFGDTTRVADALTTSADNDKGDMDQAK